MSLTFELLVALAGIAGIFVGFGALVVLSDDSAATTEELHMVRAVVSIGLITLVGALVPLGLGGFGVFPFHASALYTVAVVLNLFQCAQTLAQVVYIRVKRTA